MTEDGQAADHRLLRGVHHYIESITLTETNLLSTSLSLPPQTLLLRRPFPFMLLRMRLNSFPSLVATLLVAALTTSAQDVGVTHCKNSNVALTFDDGATKYTKEVIRQLVDANQKATLCINVNNFVCNYDQEYIDLFRYAISKRITLCNHSGGHPHMTQLTDDQVRMEIQTVNDYMNKTLGVVPRYFRFPYGESDDRTVKIVREEFRMKILAWSVDTEDSLGASVDQQLEVFKKLDKDSEDIIIMHDTHDFVVNEELPRVLKLFEKRGIKSSGAAKCLGHEHYTDAYSYFQPHSNARQPDWNCDKIPIGNP